MRKSQTVVARLGLVVAGPCLARPRSHQRKNSALGSLDGYALVHQRTRTLFGTGVLGYVAVLSEMRTLSGCIFTGRHRSALEKGSADAVLIIVKEPYPSSLSTCDDWIMPRRTLHLHSKTRSLMQRSAKQYDCSTKHCQEWARMTYLAATGKISSKRRLGHKHSPQDWNH